MVPKIRLNTSLDKMMMMMSLEKCIKPPQMIGYAKYFDSNKTISFKESDENLLKIILKYGK